MQRSLPTAAFPHGIVPSMNTPFLDDGSIDVQGIRRSVDAVITAGVAGMLVLAVAGETGSLSPSEKRLVATLFLKQAAGRVPVIIGCSSARQQERVALAAMARDLGAPAMLCQIPPGANGEKLVALVHEIAAAGPGLLMLQDLDFGGLGLPMADILLLHSQVPAFQGLKIEVSMPGPKYSAVLQATQGTLHVSGGWAAAQMPEALHRGVHAFIPTAMDAIYVEVFRRFAAGDHAGARGLHAALTPVLAFSNQHIDVSIRFFKHLRHREGLFTTALCRPGVAALDAHQQLELEINIDRVIALQGDLRQRS
ncbi:MAG: dihydrodipicolinate synthase family protein [Burkholderiaceae bacterium]